VPKLQGMCQGNLKVAITVIAGGAGPDFSERPVAASGFSSACRSDY
jgi:hypothetical protein